MKGNFRIIYLKNDESRKYRDDKLINSNIIVPPLEKRGKKISEYHIPNIVHLSARLQDDSYEQKRPQSQSYHQQINRSNQLNSISNEDFQNISHNKAEQIKRLRQLEIQKFVEKKNQNIQKQKNTMKNLLGSINFTMKKNKEKKISQIIKNACTSQRSNRRFKSLQRPVLAQNKTQLQSDFQNFLANKHQDNSPRNQDIEDFKLKRLSKVNPEQYVIQSAQTGEIKPLNLFHFLNKNYIEESPPKFKQNSRNRSSSNVKAQTFFSKGRIDKKIFNFQSNLKTQQQQFEWSKLKDPSPHQKNFTLRTLDL